MLPTIRRGTADWTGKIVREMTGLRDHLRTELRSEVEAEIRDDVREELRGEMREMIREEVAGGLSEVNANEEQSPFERLQSGFAQSEPTGYAQRKQAKQGEEE